MALRRSSVFLAAMTFLMAPRVWADGCPNVSSPAMPGRVDARWPGGESTNTSEDERKILTQMISDMRTCVETSKSSMQASLAKAQALETQIKERQALEVQKDETFVGPLQTDAAGLTSHAQQKIAGIDQDIAAREQTQIPLSESRVPLDSASKWEIAIQERLKNLKRVSTESQQKVNTASAKFEDMRQRTSMLTENMQFFGNTINPWADQSCWVWPGAYENENRPTINESRERIQAVQTQINGLNQVVAEAEGELRNIGQTERPIFAGLVKNEYSQVRGLPAGSIVGNPGQYQGELGAAYNETAPILEYASAMNGDAASVRAGHAKVGNTAGSMTGDKPAALDVEPAVAATPTGGTGGGSGGGASPAPAPSAPSAAPVPAAAPATAAAPSPTPSFQKKSSMPGWVLPAAALVVGGVGGYLVGKSAAKSSSDSSSGTASTASTSTSDKKSSSGESTSTTASESSAAKTTTSAATVQPATQETQQIAAVEAVPKVTPVQEVAATNDTRRISVASSGSAKKSWKGLKCPEVTPVESYNPVVLNSNKAMTDLRNQCLAEGGRP
jgi:hypothetical protein